MYFWQSLLIINNNCIQVIGMNNFQKKTIDGAKPKQQVKKKISKPNLIKLPHKTLRKLAQQRIKQRRIRGAPRTQAIGPRQIVFSLNKQEYNCPICLQLLTYPSSLSCGHTYCLPCLENLSKANYKKQCSVCRAEDSIEFHEIDKNVQMIIWCISTLRLNEKEKAQYQSRIYAHKQQFQSRGVKGTPKKNDLVRVKVNNHWVRGRILEIINKGSSIFYEIFAILSQELHILSKTSINIKQQKTQKPEKTIKYSNSIFSQNIFIQETFTARQPSNTYNIQQLIWQVSYYEPQQVHHSSWNFQFSHRLLEDAIEQQRIRNGSYQGLAIASIDGRTE